MTGLDTNILVRFITQDDPRQAAIANDIVERRLTTLQPGFVSVVAITEAVWVLSRYYRYSAEAIAATVERILQVETLMVEKSEQVLIAALAVKRNEGRFSDALIAALNADAGCIRSWTFDRKALRISGFELP